MEEITETLGLDLCVRLLAKDPGERYPEAAALIEDLERVSRSPEDEKTVVDAEEVVVDAIPTEETVADTIPGETGATPPIVRVPDLTGNNLSQASSALANVDLTLGSQKETPSETVPEGRITGQTPEAGIGVKPDSLVSVTVSSGSSTVEVPDLAGLNRSEVSGTLADVGLKLGSQNEVSSDMAPEGRIIGQDPVARTKVAQGSSVSVTVSSGPQEKAPAPEDVGPEQQTRRKLRKTLSAVTMIGGVMWMVWGTTRLVGLTDPTTLLNAVLLIVGCVGMLGGLVELRARQARSYGRLGAIGFSMALIGTAGVIIFLSFSLSLATFTDEASPEAIDATDATDAIAAISSLVMLVGFPLAGVATLRAKVLSRWYGVVLIVAGPSFFLLLAILIQLLLLLLPSAGARGVGILVGVGMIPFGIIWLALGYALWSQCSTPTGEPTDRR